MKKLTLILLAVVFSVSILVIGIDVYGGTNGNHGTLQVVKQAEQSGNPLSGAVFGVYSVIGDKRLADIATNVDGEASYSLEPGEYYLRELKPPYGYLLEQSRIYFTVVYGETVIVEVTNQRDPAVSNANGIITIPKTGEDFPYLIYITGAMLVGAPVFCGVSLLLRRNLKVKR